MGKVIGALILLIIVIVVVWFITKGTLTKIFNLRGATIPTPTLQASLSPTPTNILSPTPTPAGIQPPPPTLPMTSPFLTPTNIQTEINTDLTRWYTYVSKDNNFTLKFPPELKPDVNDNDGSIRFRYNGPTQKQGTELYDGFELWFNAENNYGKSISEVASERLRELRNTPIFKTGDQSPTNSQIARTNGYQFWIENNTGRTQFSEIPINSLKTLEISRSVRDINNRNYDQIVDKIFSTLVIEP